MSIDRNLALAASAAILLSLLSGMIVFFFWKRTLVLAIALALILIGVLSRYPERFSRESFGFELGVFFAICTSFSLGFIGVVVGAGYIILAGMLVREPPQDTLAGLFCIIIVTLLASVASPSSIPLYGILLVLLYDLLCLGIYSVTGHSVLGSLKFMAGHMVWNYVLFTVWGEKLVGFLSGM